MYTLFITLETYYWCALYGNSALLVRIKWEMSSDGTRPSVSFTLQKKSQPPKVRPTSEEEDKKDFVLSLVGNQIER